ncbi:MAG: DDE-type integrase/transposase/recombinase, partial [Prosthecobacter sp.]|nr:DDE-type integrase/transposase/recombinase [Prosthecobacter sp.]
LHGLSGGGMVRPEELVTLYSATQLGMKVPSLEEREALIQRAHQQLGHRARDGLFKQLYADGYYWASMRQECQSVADRCEACMKEDVSKRGFHPLALLERTFPFELVSADLFGPMPMSDKGYNYALILVDAASRYCIARALQSKTAEDVAAAMLSIFWEHGFPKCLRSDRGREFVNQIVSELASRAEIVVETTPPYSPQSNGSAESHVKLVRQALKRIMDEAGAAPNQWPDYLTAATWAANNRVAARHMSKPIELYLGRSVHALHPLSRQSSDAPSQDVPTLEQLSDRVKWLNEVIWPAARSATSAHNARRKMMVDNSRRQLALHPGDVVMVEAPPRSPKHAPAFTGPFTVLEPHSKLKSAYRLLQQDGTLLPAPVAVQRLKLVSRADVEDEYLVDRILDERQLSGRPKEFLVAWEGYDEPSWEPESSFISSDGTKTQQLLDFLSAPRSFSGRVVTGDAKS